MTAIIVMAMFGATPLQSEEPPTALCDTDTDCYNKFCVDKENPLYDPCWCHGICTDEPEPTLFTRCSGIKPWCPPREHPLCICTGRSRSSCSWACVQSGGESRGTAGARGPTLTLRSIGMRFIGMAGVALSVSMALFLAGVRR